MSDALSGKDLIRLHYEVAELTQTPAGIAEFYETSKSIEPTVLLDVCFDKPQLIRGLIENNPRFEALISSITDLVNLNAKTRAYLCCNCPDIQRSRVIHIILRHNKACRDWFENLTDLECLNPLSRRQIAAYVMDAGRCDLISRWCHVQYARKRYEIATRENPGCWFGPSRLCTNWAPLLPVLPLLLECEEPCGEMLNMMFERPSIFPAEDLWAYLIPTIIRIGSLVESTTPETSVKCLKYFADNVGSYLVEDNKLFLRDLLAGPLMSEERLALMCPDRSRMTRFGTIQELLDAKNRPLSELPRLKLLDHEANVVIINAAPVADLRSYFAHNYRIHGATKKELKRRLESLTSSF
jgi:hypothetical protein